ncbi:autotransporter-associated beta strand repeat-containing protein [Verrucomicrobiaceae bacterium N1E253]|uniref:Autotransporter-associated beta strand repeat-containing protein n=1 Tax=Oceaniferula marina TaxID=2748318 RepID=A0A851GFI1_9BACT|nr:autotransporter-associated beta strand repeat-containing protein [Oceaniferula marina]NWK56518.1 autotransporter-associated beta strand repeat-containing protein [Oceaniferula marina]
MKKNIDIKKDRNAAFVTESGMANERHSMVTRLMKSCMLMGMAGIVMTSQTSAQSISVNFGADRGGPINEAGKTSGAVLVQGDYWNNTTVNGGGTLGSLVDSTGVVTGASVTWTANNSYLSGSTGATATSENGDLTTGYLDDGGAGWSVTLDSPYLLNDIYMIQATDQGGGTSQAANYAAVSVNGTYYKGDGAGSTVLASGSADTWSGVNWTNADALLESDHYLKVEDQVSVVLAADRNSARAAIAGVQVVNAYTGTLSYWDTNGATAGAGGATPSGNWSDANWSASETGEAATSNWTGGHAAVFAAGGDATGAYTVTLGGSESVDAVWVQEGDVTLTGGTVALGGTGLLRADGASTLTIDSGLTATDLNTLGAITLNSANTVSGRATITGTTTLGADHSLGSLAGTGALAIGANALTVGSDNTDSSYLGALTGSGNLIKNGTGTLTVRNNVGYTGAATVNAGTLNVDGGGNLNWNVSGSGNFSKTGGGQLTVLSDISVTGTLTVEDDILQVGDVGTAGSIGSPSSIALNRNGLALRYRLSGKDVVLDSSSVTFGDVNSHLRQHGGTAVDKLTITNTTLAGTTTDANGSGVQGLMSSYGGELIYGTGTTATFRELQLANGNVIIEDGADVTARYLNIGNGGGTSGTITQTGGSVTMEAGSAGIRIGHWSGTGRAYNISGGTLDATALSSNGGAARYIMMGWDGEGDMTVGGGSGIATVKAAGLQFDRNRAGNGSSASTLTLLSQGVVEVGSLGIVGQGDNDGVALSGGVLKGVANSNWGSRVEAVTSTTSTIDVDNGVAVNQTGVLFGDGTINKAGDGSLVLSNAANTHTGTINVNAGTLNVSGNVSSSVVVNNGGAIQGGTDTVPGAATLTTLTTNGGSVANFRVGGGTADQINVTGDGEFTINGSHTVNIIPAGQLAINDSFILYDYEGFINGDGGDGISAVLPNPHYGVSVVNDFFNTWVTLTVDSIDSVIWTGAGGNVWDVDTTESWKTETGDTATNFYDYDIVKFDDANSSGGTINLTGDILTASTSFDHSTNDFTLTGSGIGGAGGLTKAGTGTLTLLNDNTYSGATDIQAGSVVVGNGGTSGAIGGSGDITLATGASLSYNRSDAVNLGRRVVGGGELIYNGSSTFRTGQAGNNMDITINSGTYEALEGGWATGYFSTANKVITINDGGTLLTGTHSLGGLGGGYQRPDLVINQGGTWTVNGGHYMSAGDITLNGGTINVTNTDLRLQGGTMAVNESTGGSTISGLKMTLHATPTFNVADGAADNDLTVSAVIGESGTRGFNKSGAGKMLLEAVNTFTGKITVNEGTLELGTNASVANSSEISVQSGASFNVSAVDGGFVLQDAQKLSGSGAFLGPIQLASGSVIAPGNSAGTMTFDSAMILGVGSTLDFELSGSDQTTGSGINDLMTGITDLTLDGTLNVAELVADDFLNAEAGDRWVLLEYSGTLTDNGLDLGTLPTLTAGLDFELDLSGGGEVGLVVIPEPSTFTLFGLGALALIMRRRKS